MQTRIDFDELSDVFSPKVEALPISKEKDLIGRVDSLVADLFDDLPYENSKPLLAHPPIGGLIEAKTAKAAAPRLFPNLPLELLNFGLEVEKSYNAKLHQHADEATDIQQTLKKLVDLSGKFAMHTANEGEQELSDEIQSICLDLKSHGIEILQDNEKKMSRDRIEAVKALIGSHNEQLKIDLKKKFDTEIQVKINELHSILECLKTIEKYASRQNSTSVSNQRSR